MNKAEARELSYFTVPWLPWETQWSDVTLKKTFRREKSDIKKIKVAKGDGEIQWER